MPPERAEDMAQLNLGVEFLRLGAWDDYSSVRLPVLLKAVEVKIYVDSHYPFYFRFVRKSPQRVLDPNTSCVPFKLNTQET